MESDFPHNDNDQHYIWFNACFGQLLNAREGGGRLEGPKIPSSISDMLFSFPVYYRYLDWFQRQKGCQVEVPLSPSCWTWVGSSAGEFNSDSRQWEWALWPGLHCGWPGSLFVWAQAGCYVMIFLFISPKRTQSTKGGRGSPLPFSIIAVSLGKSKVTHSVFLKTQHSWHILSAASS